MKTALTPEDKIKIRVMEVTPEWATDILEKCKLNPSYINRPLNERKVNEYARDMKRGMWLPNHQGIAFDENGTLIDGQHRLWSVILSESTVTMTVSWGWDENYKNGGIEMSTRDTIDKGRTRSVGQQLGLHGQKNAHNFATALRTIGIIITGNPGIGMSHGQHLVVSEFYKKDIDTIIAQTTACRQRVSFLLAPFSLYHHMRPERAIEFVTTFFSLENLSSTDPRLVLNRWVMNNAGRANTSSQLARFSMNKATAQALKAFDEGRTLHRISPSDEHLRWLLELQHAPEIKKIRDSICVKGVDFGNRKKEES